MFQPLPWPDALRSIPGLWNANGTPTATAKHHTEGQREDPADEWRLGPNPCQTPFPVFIYIQIRLDSL